MFNNSESVALDGRYSKHNFKLSLQPEGEAPRGISPFSPKKETL
jgi:hypothetical protein